MHFYTRARIHQSYNHVRNHSYLLPVLLAFYFVNLAYCEGYSSYRSKQILQEFSIGQIASATGTNVQTIRYYETRGLMPEPMRNASGQRLYTEKDRNRLAFVRHARSLGFSLEQICTLLELADQPEKPCASADAIVADNLEKVRQRIAALSDLEQELAIMLNGKCGENGRSCRVIETLANHQLCLHQQHKQIEGKGLG